MKLLLFIHKYLPLKSENMYKINAHNLTIDELAAINLHNYRCLELMLLEPEYYVVVSKK